MNSPTANQLANQGAMLSKRLPTGIRRFSGFCFFVLLCFVAAVPARSEEDVDPHEILKAVRLAQSSQSSSLTGAIRTGGKSLPFQLVSSRGTIRYEFKDPAQVIQLRLGDKEARLEEISGTEKAQKVSPKRFDDRVRDTDISY